MGHGQPSILKVSTYEYSFTSAHEQQLDQLRPLQRIEIKIHRAEQMAHKRSSAESPISRGHVAGVSGRR